MKLDFAVVIEAMIQVKGTGFSQFRFINGIYTFIGEQNIKYHVEDISEGYASNVKTRKAKVRSNIVDGAYDPLVIATMPNYVKRSILPKLQEKKYRDLVDSLLSIIRSDSQIGLTAKERMERLAADTTKLPEFLSEVILYTLQHALDDTTAPCQINNSDSGSFFPNTTIKSNPFNMVSKEFPMVEVSEYIPRHLEILQNNEKTGVVLGESDILCRPERISCVIAEGGMGKTELMQHVCELAGDNSHYAACVHCVNALDEGTNLSELFPVEKRQSISLLILDGFDEIINTKGKTKLLAKVKALMDRTSVKFLFTARTDADARLIEEKTGEPVTTFLLLPFSEDDCISLSKQVLQGDDVSSFLNLIGITPNDAASPFEKTPESVKEICKNPFYFRRLLSNFKRTSNIPRTRIDLLEDVIKTVLSREEDLAALNEYSAHDYIGDSIRLESVLGFFATEKYTKPEKEDFSIFLNFFTAEKVKNPSIYARHICSYLHARGLLVDGTFSHQLLLEYLTAKAYWNNIEADDYSDKCIRELFAHYSDPRWNMVFKLFLEIAEEKSTSNRRKQLYTAIVDTGLITDYTLLFDFFLSVDKDYPFIPKLKLFIGDILTKSLDGRYPAYGPLFWYIPHYRCLYGLLVEVLQENFLGDARALALVRDVLFIFGGYNTIDELTHDELTQKVDGQMLFSSVESNLCGVRRALCELFYTGSTNYEGGNDIYPRCFNVGEAKALHRTGAGLLTRATKPFDDELNLYNHYSLNMVENEPIGFVSLPYNQELAKQILDNGKLRIRGVAFTPTETGSFGGEDVYYFRASGVVFGNIEALFPPENCVSDSRSSQSIRLRMPVFISQNGICYTNKTGHVELPHGITSIPEYTFWGSDIRSIRIPGSLKTIPSYAFAACSKLEEVQLNDGIEEIDITAFNGCSRLTELRIPKTVASLFYKYPCDGGTERNIPNLKHLYIPSHLAYLMPGDSRVVVYDSDVGTASDSKHIADHAFRGKALESFQIPNGTLTVGRYAFANCANLRDVIISKDVTILDDNCFDGCSALECIDIPDSVVSIGKQAFRDCLSLGAVCLPKDLRRIPQEAFSTTNIRSVRLPQSCKIIEDGAFCYCDALTDIMFSTALTSIGRSAFCFCTNLTVADLSHCEELCVIGGSAFNSCEALQTVLFPSCLTTIERSAFDGCSNLNSVVIPKSVEHIGKYAFYDCHLSSIHISRRFENQIEDIFGEIDRSILHFI